MTAGPVQSQGAEWLGMEVPVWCAASSCRSVPPAPAAPGTLPSLRAALTHAVWRGLGTWAQLWEAGCLGTGPGD